MSIGVENNRLVMDPQNLRERLSVLGFAPVPEKVVEADPVSSFTVNAAVVSNENNQLSVYDPVAKGLIEEMRMSWQMEHKDVVLEPIVEEYSAGMTTNFEPVC